jgi:hypothetical protein
MNAGLDSKAQAKDFLLAGIEDSQDMIVARLGDSEGLLVYNPCRFSNR